MQMRLTATVLALMVMSGCNAQPTTAANRHSVGTAVGLLVPATSDAAHAMGVTGWEIRVGRPGLQVAGVATDGRRVGSALFTLQSNGGVDNGLLVVRAKLGTRGQLAYGADGTLYENTLSSVSNAPDWLGAMSSDLGHVGADGIVPYDATSDCIASAISTAMTCITGALGAAGCGAGGGAGCVGGLPAVMDCARGLSSIGMCIAGAAAGAAGGAAGAAAGAAGGAPGGAGAGDPGGAGAGDPGGAGAGDPGGAGGDPWGDPGAGDPGAGDPGAGDPGAGAGDWGGDDSDSDGWEDDWGTDGSGDYGGSGGSGDWGSDDSGWDDSGAGTYDV